MPGVKNSHLFWVGIYTYQKIRELLFVTFPFRSVLLALLLNFSSNKLFSSDKINVEISAWNRAGQIGSSGIRERLDKSKEGHSTGSRATKGNQHSGWMCFSLSYSNYTNFSFSVDSLCIFIHFFLIIHAASLSRCAKCACLFARFYYWGHDWTGFSLLSIFLVPLFVCTISVSVSSSFPYALPILFSHRIARWTQRAGNSESGKEISAKLEESEHFRDWIWILNILRILHE